jgi:hypothetical protein
VLCFESVGGAGRVDVFEVFKKFMLFVLDWLTLICAMRQNTLWPGASQIWGAAKISNMALANQKTSFLWPLAFRGVDDLTLITSVCQPIIRAEDV